LTNAEIAARLFISRLIGDITVFTVETSGPALAASVSAMGNPARWVWAGTGEIPPGEVVMEMTSKKSWPYPAALFLEYSKILQMRGRELDRYLIELAEQKTWIEGAKFMLADPDTQTTAITLCWPGGCRITCEGATPAPVIPMSWPPSAANAPASAANVSTAGPA
jgi:hypothetical protein